MAVHTLDVLGLKCPQPVLKLAAMARNIPAGDTVEVIADCESFPKDVEAWCGKTGKRPVDTRPACLSRWTVRSV